ncbi:MAG: pyruvate ferredoxin oxidoreductase, partial [Planctomycetota bacterium]|nr:pyruvate ferredoxin oxidoreductase [Planctomycetota bacterium]MDI6787941.1 pyruvate ferredoxin oxidoreductase [Planctomycetota bacterium]
FELKYKIQEAMEQGLIVAQRVDKEFKRSFGRSYGIIEPYHCDDAEIVLVTSSTITSTTRQVIDELRKHGEKIGLLKIRLFRPFPAQAVVKALEHCKKVAVIDRNIGYGVGGIFCQEIRASFCNMPRQPYIYGYITGIGGRDVTPDTIREIIDHTKKNKKPNNQINYIGLRK